MEAINTLLYNALMTRAIQLLHEEMKVEKEKHKLRAYWRGIMHLLDVPSDNEHLRMGYGMINLMKEEVEHS